MNQLISSKICREWLVTQKPLPHTAPEDFVIRGLVVTSEKELQLFLNGDVDVNNGDLKLDAVAQDYCYNYIPLEIPIESGDIVKLYQPTIYNASPSLLSDKFIDFRRFIENWSDKRWTWTGDQPDIEEDQERGKIGAFGDITQDAYANKPHSHIMLATWIYLDMDFSQVNQPQWYPVLRWRCDDDSSDCYEWQVCSVKLYGPQTGYQYLCNIGGRLIRKVSGQSDVVVYDGTPTGGGTTDPNAYDQCWWAFRVYHVGNKISIVAPGCYPDLVDTSEYAIDEGDYFCVPSGAADGDLKFDDIEIW